MYDFLRRCRLREYGLGDIGCHCRGDNHGWDGPEQPVVNTNPGSPYYGYVYVPNAVKDESASGTLMIISPDDNSVIRTMELGSSSAPGGFFDSENSLVYAGGYVINGTTELTEVSAGCDSRCVLDTSNGDIYAAGGTT